MNHISAKKYIFAQSSEHSFGDNVIEFSAKALESNPVLMHKYRNRFSGIQRNEGPVEGDCLPDIIA